VQPDGSTRPDPRRESYNLLGQTAFWGIIHAITFLVLFYACRTLIMRKSVSRAEATAWYSMMLLASLPYIWLLVGIGWNDPGTSDLACWIFMPGALLIVATAGFIVILAGHPRSGTYQALLTALELLVLLPLWVVVWAVLAFGIGLFRLYPPL
jgi:hypothetical protein